MRLKRKAHEIKEHLPLITKAALCCFLWATAIPTLKVTYSLLAIESGDTYNRLVLAGMRFSLSAVLIAIYMLIKEGRLTIVKGIEWRTVLIFGLLNTTFQYLFFYIGVGNTPAIKSVLIDASKPLMVVVLAHFLTKDDRLSLAKTMGILLGFIGILLVNVEGLLGGGLNAQVTMRGEGFLLVSSLASAGAVLYGKKAMKTIPSLVLNMHQMFLGASILGVIGLVGAGGYRLAFTPLAVVLLVYSSCLSAIAFVVWYHLIHKYGASSVSVYIFLIPIFGAIISSTLFEDEHLTWHICLSLVLMCLSIYLVNRKEKIKVL